MDPRHVVSPQQFDSLMAIGPMGSYGEVGTALINNSGLNGEVWGGDGI